MLVRIANREDPDLTASYDLGPHCLSWPFWQAASVKILERLGHLSYHKNKCKPYLKFGPLQSAGIRSLLD